MQSEQINEIATALSKAQGEYKIVKNNRKGYKGTYADLHAIMSATREPLSKNGLCLYFESQIDSKGREILITKLVHTSGQWISSAAFINPEDDTQQGYGLALSYKQRYGAKNVLGVTTMDDEDDDDTQPTKTPYISFDESTTMNDKFMGYPAHLKKMALDNLKIKDFTELKKIEKETALTLINKILKHYNNNQI